MATNKRATLFWSTTIIATGIAAGFLVLSMLPLPPTTPVVADRPDVRVEEPERPGDCKSSAEYLLRCLKLLSAGVDPDRDIHLDSVVNKHEVLPCRMDLHKHNLVVYYYGKKDNLPAGYVESLQFRYKNNQALVDIRICGLDFNCCWTETKPLRTGYFDRLQIEYNYNQTLVDFDFKQCSAETKELRSGYHNQLSI